MEEFQAGKSYDFWKNDSEYDAKDHYKCYLNGKFYGSGSLDYMHELFKDYVITCKMYGKKECDFKIVIY